MKIKTKNVDHTNTDAMASGSMLSNLCVCMYVYLSAQHAKIAYRYSENE